MRIIFAGTPDFAAAHLQALLDDGQHQVVAVYTQPDRRAGRGKKLLPSPVKLCALQAGLAVQQPLSLKGVAAQEVLAEYRADIMVVVAYGLLLPAAVLALPRFGCINVHASLLPRWRGAAPIERAIIAGDEKTGITLMQMDEGLDTGDCLLRADCHIDSDETGDSLRQKLTGLGAPLLLQTLAAIASQSLSPQPQNNAYSCYAEKIDKAEAAIDWRQPAPLIARKIRALTSALNCYGILDGQRIQLRDATVAATKTTENNPAPAGTLLASDRGQLKIQCGEQALTIGMVQLPGGRPMSVGAFRNGKPALLTAGQRFAVDGG